MDRFNRPAVRSGVSGRFRQAVRREVRCACAALLCFCLIAGSLAGMFPARAEDTESCMFALTREALGAAVQKAVAEGASVEEDFCFRGQAAQEYADLLEADGSLYELKLPERKENGVTLRVFARVDGPQELDGTCVFGGEEPFVFLLVNAAGEERSVTVSVDQRVTEKIFAVPASAVKLTEKEIREGSASGFHGSPNESSGTDAVSGRGTDVPAGSAETERAALPDGSTGEGINRAQILRPEDSPAESLPSADDAEPETVPDTAGFAEKQSRAREKTEQERADMRTERGKMPEAGEDRPSGTGEADDAAGLIGAGDSARQENGEKTNGKEKNGAGNAADAEGTAECDENKTAGADEVGSAEPAEGKADSRPESSSENSEISASEKADDGAFSAEDAGRHTAEISVRASRLLAAAAGRATPANAAAGKGAQAATASDASASDADRTLLDGTVFEAVLLGRRAVTAFETTAADLGLNQEEEKIATPSSAASSNWDFVYEDTNADYTVRVHLDGGVSRAKTASDSDAQEFSGGTDPEPFTMEVTPVEAGSEVYARLASAALERGGAGLFSLTVMEFSFYSGEEELDVSDCRITAEITPGESLLASGSRAAPVAVSAADLAGGEAETGASGAGNAAAAAARSIALTALQTDGETVIELGSIAQTEIDATPENMKLNVSLDAGQVLALTGASENANPAFTVQYYAYVDTVSAKDTGTALEAIDTSGGNLPVNGTAPATKKLYLQESDGGYILATEDVLTEVYRSCDYEYVTAGELRYINRLAKNSNYTLKEIRVLKSGADPGSTAVSDWAVYPASAAFTNNSSRANGTDTILIQENTVLRLVYNTTDGSYNNAAAFYDYDITDGNFYKSADRSGGIYKTQDEAGKQAVYAYTGESGINSAANYTGNGTKLAFGNANTGTGLDGLKWDGNLLNAYNRSGGGFQGCTFGLVTGLGADGTITYADGVSAPNLFNDGSAVGKTEFHDYSLNFRRDGDTYTLFSAEGAGSGASGLDRFSHITSYAGGTVCNLYTNFFWPMDSAVTFGAPGHDLKFGQYEIREQRRFFGNGSGTFPTVDENRTKDVDHNCNFGMQYAVQFDLSADYVGPLEYYFFGDDDMWVFLDGRLVCDIGGVHSSVGEYVNLWDYVEKGSSGIHTLSFFYTERGESGSSCYMRFTLPSVSSVEPGRSTGGLRVAKTVSGAQENKKDFSFTLRLNGSGSNDSYTIIRYDRDGSEVEKRTIANKGTFQLRHDQYAVISGMPGGLQYTVTETGADGYVTTVNGKTRLDRTAAGSIDSDRPATVSVDYVNTVSARLPETGGSGVFLYAAAGLLLMVLPMACEYTCRRTDGGRNFKKMEKGE